MLFRSEYLQSPVDCFDKTISNPQLSNEQREARCRKIYRVMFSELVLESLKAGKKPQDWTPEEIAAFSPEFTADMAKLLYPKEGMKTRALRGGTAPAAVAVALAEAQARLNQMRS